MIIINEVVDPVYNPPRYPSFGPRVTLEALQEELKNELLLYIWIKQ